MKEGGRDDKGRVMESSKRVREKKRQLKRGRGGQSGGNEQI